ncbi:MULTISPECIES: type I-F CRISPR-associated protein Csy1 [unclassified Vibrio]|uniref:Type I-F CRISPR-associated protein Csy1 n=1 Tax=Vibrio sp. HB236076 TaxID=3232307 RepID=A0AB39HGF0_9VIBR|nr:type I-F CRISPR-associated protein Csy1 [Vibrio sp. HB161653]MDP5255750.1 type I-F CRISPR-associated protein Csy1 [Vibrio sp. HB161653]
MEKEKCEVKKNLDRLIKNRPSLAFKKKDKNGKAKPDYFKVLDWVLRHSSQSYLPKLISECDACLLMISSINEGATTYKFENTFKFMCEICHPKLDELWSLLDISIEEAAVLIELSKSFCAEKLEAYFFFKDGMAHDEIVNFEGEAVAGLIEKVAQGSKHGTVVSHPSKMSHPACKYPRVYSTDFKNSQDGYLRSGNAETMFDLHINATQLKVYKFLSLKINGIYIFEHLRESNVTLLSETFRLTELFFESIVNMFAECIYSQSFDTDRFVKQVYFPIGFEQYHQLSLLIPAGLVFNMKSKIDWITSRSPEAYTGKNARKNNDYHELGYKTISDLTVTKHGGDHPKNISGLNNKHQTYYLLSSKPPELTPRDIRLPKKDFFKESFTAWQARDVLEALHRLFLTDHNNINIRDGRDYRIQQYVDLVIEKMWQVRSFLEVYSGELSSSLPSEQRIWLYPEFSEQRHQEDEWLDKLTRHITRGLINHYGRSKVIANPVILADQELLAIENVVASNKENLR